MSQIKPVIRCDETAKQKFSVSKCLLTISVGQGTHEEERFSSTMELIGKTFSSCTIALHDSLQRYSMALNHERDEDYFHSIATLKGEEWMNRNEKYYKDLKIPLTVTRWDNWLNDRDFLSSKLKVQNEIARDENYRMLFDQSVAEYLTRHCRRLKEPDLFNRKRAERLCFDYLLEECAILCLWAKTGCHFEMYAGNHNAAMIATREKFVRPDVLQSIKINFNHRPNLSPQNFGIIS